ncbi:F0F1 ATP synthase subunit epsilon [Cobetia marina]|uniref:ATP synthase epsilon chain n=1 Tax=Cobetia marina TaxID=28258 RepID=A0ABU9G9R9_COBMA|nr:F0F1 ATP synthase subunit epsilon [Cobetia marina]AOM01198.1 F0F1 ATP synthase subunit epsilon [Cobetia marina]TKD61644.1 F0F1 ATP synthase subunit epsilon [Cobetia marina]GED43357.1 ATP synthase epsilon chain 2 [Cobetia marina]
MRLIIVTPLTLIADRQIDSLRAEDASGSFGILTGHSEFLTALEISALSWREGESQHFCAIRGGVLNVSRGEIHIATREAVLGDDLDTLDSEVLARFRADADTQRTEHVESMRLQLNALRHIIRRRTSSADSGEFR